MLDIVSWKLFEKTGCIDAYLLYNDIKKLDELGDFDESINPLQELTNVK